MHLQKVEVAVVVLLLFAAVAISAVAFVSTGAPGQPYTGTSKAGDTVHLEGLLLHKEKTNSGGHLLLKVKSGTDLVTVFVSAASNAHDTADVASEGKMIAVVGKVQDYKGNREITATSITIE